MCEFIRRGGRTAVTAAARSALTLPLLVPRVRGANDVDLPLAADDLAVLANPLDAGSHLHGDHLPLTNEPGRVSAMRPGTHGRGLFRRPYLRCFSRHAHGRRLARSTSRPRPGRKSRGVYAEPGEVLKQPGGLFFADGTRVESGSRLARDFGPPRRTGRSVHGESVGSTEMCTDVHIVAWLEPIALWIPSAPERVRPPVRSRLTDRDRAVSGDSRIRGAGRPALSRGLSNRRV